MKVEYIIAYGIVNLLAFMLMAYDKRMAIVKGWRIPEKVLLSLSALGGAAGTYAALKMWRHKKNKFRFSAGVPLMFLGHLYVVYKLLQ